VAGKPSRETERVLARLSDQPYQALAYRSGRFKGNTVPLTPGSQRQV